MLGIVVKALMLSTNGVVSCIILEGQVMETSYIRA